MDFANKVVIVTGASSGIGAASAILFAKHGAKLSLVGRNEQRLKSVANKCYEANGCVPLALQIDLTLQGSCETVINKTVAKFEKIDVLVNCAAKFLIGTLFDDNINAFDEMININLRVPYQLTRLAVPYLVKTKGNIINFNENYTRIKAGYLPYSVSKAALERFSKSSAMELASEGVRVNSIQPGILKKNRNTNLEVRQEDRNDTYNTSNLEPEEVAKMVLFVASGLCPNINGANLTINAVSTYT
ncbi:unnamed protein product [Arctia plantaginis]|uniref:Uncharacterized protein n=1 Tax=Arctia plantaginis TaxID=874455 RepID=A0A8S1AIZ7_ARCPL|nr:unnamed protein product [Arctia plantaginis]